MDWIAQINENCQHFSRRMHAFFLTYKLGEILRASNVCRERGISPLRVIMYLPCISQYFHGKRHDFTPASAGICKGYLLSSLQFSQMQLESVYQSAVQPDFPSDHPAVHHGEPQKRMIIWCFCPRISPWMKRRSSSGMAASGI